MVVPSGEPLGWRTLQMSVRDPANSTHFPQPRLRCEVYWEKGPLHTGQNTSYMTPPHAMQASVACRPGLGFSVALLTELLRPLLFDHKWFFLHWGGLWVCHSMAHKDAFLASSSLLPTTVAAPIGPTTWSVHTLANSHLRMVFSSLVSVFISKCSTRNGHKQGV